LTLFFVRKHRTRGGNRETEYAQSVDHQRRGHHRGLSQRDTHSELGFHDVRLLIENQLTSREVQKKVPQNWPGQKICDDVARQANGLFIWASTVCRQVINAAFPDEELDILTQRTILGGINELYRVALDRALPVEDESLRKMTTFVLGNIVASLEPLSIAAWTQLLANSKGMGGRKFETVVKRLGSVLNLDTEGVSGVRFLHPTFREFLITEATEDIPNVFFVQLSSYRHDLGFRCLGVIWRELHRDHCQLKNPSVKSGVPNLSDLIGKKYVRASSLRLSVLGISCDRRPVSQQPAGVEQSGGGFLSHIFLISGRSNELDEHHGSFDAAT